MYKPFSTDCAGIFSAFKTGRQSLQMCNSSVATFHANNYLTVPSGAFEFFSLEFKAGEYFP